MLLDRSWRNGGLPELLLHARVCNGLAINKIDHGASIHSKDCRRPSSTCTLITRRPYSETTRKGGFKVRAQKNQMAATLATPTHTGSVTSMISLTTLPRRHGRRRVKARTPGAEHRRHGPRLRAVVARRAVGKSSTRA